MLDHLLELFSTFVFVLLTCFLRSLFFQCGGLFGFILDDLGEPTGGQKRKTHVQGQKEDAKKTLTLAHSFGLHLKYASRKELSQTTCVCQFK